jgi:hypothetical protein
MSLPNYLAKIKSSGMYRFTFDKSQIPAAAAETMRLVVGYSEKGPFNNPVYIDNKQDFINLFGNVNKRLEKKGIFFHRMALQALSAGPILALNLKPFGASGEAGTAEQVEFVSFNTCDVANLNAIERKVIDVRNLFDRNRFWKLDADQLASKIAATIGDNKYINIAATDTVEQSCSIFVRKCHANDVKQYEVSVRDWYMNLGEDMPEYLEDYKDSVIKDYFAEVYVFRGEFTDALKSGALVDYFDATTGALKVDYVNNFNEPSDALAALASDANSNFIGLYRGCLLPHFKDMNGNFISLDVVFNADKDSHKMIMKLDDAIIEDVLDITDGHNQLNHWASNVGWTPANLDVNSALMPTYIKGYTYGTIDRRLAANAIQDKSISVLAEEKGIFEALTNHVDSEYHYIIDTYVGRADTDNKKYLISSIAKAKDNCLAIMNFPAMNELNNKSGFSLSNLKSYVSLPTEVNGASYCAFYTPLIIAEGNIKTTVPSAALVSNNFMEKWNSRQPYYIVAGPNYGRMDYEGLIGPDYNYSKSDLDYLEPFGVNCMVYVPRKGTYINSNQTAKQTPVSALSKVHVRELVIYLQNEIENMMQDYQWELNTQTLRDTIKTKADVILDRIKANGGVYDYINVCDASNNTPEVIDNEMVILDTSIEPARGAGKMVQRLTIHKTGGISSLTK